MRQEDIKMKMTLDEALNEADRLKSKGWEIVNIYQSPKDVTIYTKEVK